MAMGLLTAEQLEEVLRLQKDSAYAGTKKRIGEICVERGYMREEQIEEVLYEQVMKYISYKQPVSSEREASAAAAAPPHPTVRMPAESSEPASARGGGGSRANLKSVAGRELVGKSEPKVKGKDAANRAAAGRKIMEKNALLPKGCLGRTLLAALAAAAAAWGLAASSGL